MVSPNNQHYFFNKKPATIEEISIQLQFQSKENILETLIYLLDPG